MKLNPKRAKRGGTKRSHANNTMTKARMTLIGDTSCFRISFILLAFAPQISFGNPIYLPPVITMPLTNDRCPMKKRITMGIITRTEPAINKCHFSARRAV